MKIAEIYRSLQGEGFLTGAPSAFVRTSGCNLRCWFCDTPYTSWEPEGDDLAPDDVVARVDELGCSHVVLTGGEPMLYAELVPLAAALQRRGYHITIETAGTLDLPVVCDLMSISPKRPGSAPPRKRDARWHRRHEQTRHRPEVIAQLAARYFCQFKFVIDTPGDVDDVLAYLADMSAIEPARVLLMPQGTEAEELAERARWLAPLCRQHGLTYCPRRQIEWFGYRRGT